MPKSWIDTFECVQPEKLSELLDFNKKQTDNLWPLSILALRSLLQQLTIDRAPQNFDSIQVSRIGVT